MPRMGYLFKHVNGGDGISFFFYPDTNQECQTLLQTSTVAPPSVKDRNSKSAPVKSNKDLTERWERSRFYLVNGDNYGAPSAHDGATGPRL